MTMEEILNAGMVVTYNVALAKEIGLAEAIILNTIKQAGMTENGYVSYSSGVWTNLTGLTEKQAQKALDNLVKLGYLDIRTVKENDIESVQYRVK